MSSFIQILPLSLLALLSLPAWADEVPAPSPADEQALEEGVSALEHHHLERAASLLFQFLRTAPATHERYAWAQWKLASAFKDLGLSHAATVYLSRIARERTDPAVLSPALTLLKELARGPHDDLMVEDWVFGSLDVAFLPEELTSYADYVQGRNDLRQHRSRWANDHFSKIEEGSPEAFRSRYAVLLDRLNQATKVSDALIHQFEQLAEDPKAPALIRAETQLAVARLRYETGDFKGALTAYEQVKLPPRHPARAALYTEQAWTRYRTGDVRGAMGLLTALDAPSFKGEFVPDKDLLRALIYRDLCHELPAMRAARELTRRYASSLEAIQNRRDLSEDPALRKAALAHGAANRAGHFANLLEREADELPRHALVLGNDLYLHLVQLYGVARAEATRRLESALTDATQEEANRLMVAVEQVRLIEDEVAQQVFRRNKNGGNTVVHPEDDAVEPADVRYRFGGEYWNDELRNYRLELKNRCDERASL